MLTVTFQTNNKIQRKTLNGKEYLVAPVIAVKEGVLNGELLKAEEINRFVEAWNGIPVTVNHPKKGKNKVSANSPNIREKYATGFLFNSKFAENKLKAEIWIDPDKIKNIDEGPKALEKIKRGKPLDVSTAYFADTSNEVGKFNGQKYNGVQYNIRPDHLALLPDETGACSWEDGCGVRANRSRGGDKLKTNLLSEARTPTYEGIETSEWSRPTLNEHCNAKGYEDIETVDDLSDNQKQEMAEDSLLGDPDADTYQELTFFIVVNPETDNLNKNALVAVRSGRGQNADIPDRTYNSADKKAKQLLAEEFDVEYENNINDNSSMKKLLNKFAGIFGYEVQSKTNNKEGENEMEREKLISNILDTDCNFLNEETLETMKDEELEKYSNELECNSDDNDTGEDTKTNEDNSNPENEKIKVLEEKIEKLEEKLEENEKKDKQPLINTIMNTNQEVFEEEELKEFSTNKLEALAREFAGSDYSGRVIPKNNENDTEVPEAPAILLNSDDEE